MCVLQPVSTVAPAAGTEAGAQPQKEGETYMSSVSLLSVLPVLDFRDLLFQRHVLDLVVLDG